MNHAGTMAPGRGDTDLILAGLANDVTARGLWLCETVQSNTKRADRGPCDMDVPVLPDGPVLRISQDRARAARGCRLDPQALEAAVGLVSARFQSGADLLIITKFGKHEAEGRGFRSVIAEAVARDVPVLVGLNGLNRDAFVAFVEGLGTHLPPDRAALCAWAEDVVKRAAEAARGYRGKLRNCWHWTRRVAPKPMTRNDGCSRRRRAALAFVTIWLSGCGADGSDVGNFGARPPVVEYAGSSRRRRQRSWPFRRTSRRSWKCQATTT